MVWRSFCQASLMCPGTPLHFVFFFSFDLGRGIFACMVISVRDQFYQSSLTQGQRPPLTVLQWAFLSLLPYGSGREFLWNLHIEGEWLGHGLILYILLLQQCLSALCNGHTRCSGHTRYSSPGSYMKFSQSPHTCLHLISSSFLIFANLIGVK